MIILGIDPGTTIMGFGIIRVQRREMEFVQMNELMLTKYRDPFTKLKLIFDRTLELIDTYHPDEIAIEAPFYGKNVQSMLKLGRAQGVAMAAGLSRQVPITEYLPKKIKMSGIRSQLCPSGSGQHHGKRECEQGTGGPDAADYFGPHITAKESGLYRWPGRSGLPFL